MSDNELYYNELIRQLNMVDESDNSLNRKVDLLLGLNALVLFVLSSSDFLSIYTEGNIVIKHLFIFAFIFLILSICFSLKLFIGNKLNTGLKISKVQNIKQKHQKVESLTIVIEGLKRSIKHNSIRLNAKYKNFYLSLFFLLISITMFIGTKIYTYYF